MTYTSLETRGIDWSRQGCLSPPPADSPTQKIATESRAPTIEASEDNARRWDSASY